MCLLTVIQDNVQPALSQSPQSSFGGSAGSDTERQLMAQLTAMGLEKLELKRKLEQRDQALEVCQEALQQRDRALEAEREKRFEAERVALVSKNSIHPDCEHARKEREEHFEEKTDILQSKHDHVQSNLQELERKSGHMKKTLFAQTENVWARRRTIDALKKKELRLKSICAAKRGKLPRGSFLVDASKLQPQRKSGSAGRLHVDSQVMDDDSRLSTCQKYNIGRGRGSKGFPRGANSYRNIAGKTTTTTTKAPTRKRDGEKGGVEKDEKLVAEVCFFYCDNSCSVKVAATGHSDIQARLATKVVYEPEPLKGHSYRGKLDAGKGPVDTFGKMSESCLLAALFPFFMAIDVLLWPFFKSTDSLSLSLDISPVDSCHLMGCQVTGTKIRDAGRDALGNPLLDAESLTHPTFAAHVHNKMVKMWSNPNRDAAGVQSTSVAILVSALLAMSNLLAALLTHDCVFLILDGGVECTGTKGKKRRGPHDHIQRGRGYQSRSIHAPQGAAADLYQ